MNACIKCGGARRPKHYLCQRCWYALGQETRRRLWQHDELARARVLELYQQIRAGVELPEIVVGA